MCSAGQARKNSSFDLGHKRQAMRTLLLATLAAAAAVAFTANAQDFRADDLETRSIQRRAVEAVIWGMPSVNTDLMRQEMLTKTPGKVNQVTYRGRPLDWHNQTLTPSPDAIYFIAFFDTRDGPIVFEIPPGDAKSDQGERTRALWGSGPQRESRRSTWTRRQTRG